MYLFLRRSNVLYFVLRKMNRHSSYQSGNNTLAYLSFVNIGPSFNLCIEEFKQMEEIEREVFICHHSEKLVLEFSLLSLPLESTTKDGRNSGVTAGVRIGMILKNEYKMKITRKLSKSGVSETRSHQEMLVDGME